MSVRVERLEKDMAKLTMELGAEQLEDAMREAFNKSENRFNTPDFRKNKAPRVMIEKMYGEGIFYEEAADRAISTTYMEAVDESGLEIVFRLEAAVEQIGEDKPFIYTTTMAVRPEVILGEYKGVEVEEVDATVRPEDVEAELKKVQEQNARLLTVEDRPVADSDQIVIDFEGSVDGKTFDDDKAADYPLTIGSHSFVDTFGEQLIDENIGEEREINVAFPGKCHAAELTEEPATFKVTVKETKVKELPELDGELAGEVSEFDALGEYKKDIEAKILEREQKKVASENKNRVVDKVVADISMEILGRMAGGQINNMVQGTVCRMESQGPNMDLYMKYTGMTMEQMKEQMKPQVLKRIQIRLVLEKVVKAESLQVSGKRLDKGIVKMTTVYQMEADKLKGYISDRGKDQMKEDIAVRKAVDFLAAEAKPV